ncbi:hypothetical protein ACWFPQ_25300, partial [Peribacillus butanolivorans]
MIEIEKPKIETFEINDDTKFGKFVVEPLERGYGTTSLSYTHIRPHQT